MNVADIPRLRLYNQYISRPTLATPHDVVAWLGAMQAQDYAGAKWAVALRTPAATEADIDRAIADRQIVRTWPMRGTLHLVAAEDIRWLVALLGPRQIAAAAGRRRNLALDEVTLTRAREIIETALAGGRVLTRTELCRRLDAAGITTAGQRGIHILSYLSQLGVLCFGPHDAKQPTFVRMDDWVAPTAALHRDEALARLAERFVRSHGPVTDRDLARWAGLPLGDARRGLEAARAKLEQVSLDGQMYWQPTAPSIPAAPGTYLLPGFDEYILGYKDRTPVIDEQHSQKIVPGNNGMFKPAIIIDGRVAGTWKRTLKKTTLDIILEPFTPLAPAQLAAIEPAATRYHQYLGCQSHQLQVI